VAENGLFSRIRQVAPMCFPSYTKFFGPDESSSQTASRSIHSCSTHIFTLTFDLLNPHILYTLYFTTDVSRIFMFPWGIRAPDYSWFLRPTKVTNPNGTCGQFNQQTYTDRQTDRPGYMCSNRPHFIVCIAMRPKNRITFNRRHDIRSF